jgi:uncharacterized protein (TIGR03435 family)
MNRAGKNKRHDLDQLLSRNLIPSSAEMQSRLDHIWGRLRSEMETTATERVSITVSIRPSWVFSKPAWLVPGIVLAAVLLNVLVWRYGPPFARAVKTASSGDHSFLKSASQQPVGTLQIAAPQDAFDLASVKLLPPSSETVEIAIRFDQLQLMLSGCGGGYIGGTRVDPGRLTIPAMTVLSLVIVAYGHDCSLVEGGPAWARSGDYYEIQALLPAATPRYTVQDLQKGNAPELQRMLQNLLADRFRLVLKREFREMQVYALTVATPGKMKLSPDETVPPPSLPPPPGLPAMPPLQPLRSGQKLSLILPGYRQMSGHAISMSELAKDLSQAGRIVVDRTGLTGVFDYDLKFAPEQPPPTVLFPGATPQPLPPLPGTALPAPTLRDVLADQLGLKLESARMPIEVLVIESVARPSEN